MMLKFQITFVLALCFMFVSALEAKESNSSLLPFFQKPNFLSIRIEQKEKAGDIEQKPFTQNIFSALIDMSSEKTDEKELPEEEGENAQQVELDLPEVPPSFFSFTLHYQFLHDGRGPQETDLHAIDFNVLTKPDDTFLPFVRNFVEFGEVRNQNALRAGIVPGIRLSTKAFGSELNFEVGGGYAMSKNLTSFDDDIQAFRFHAALTYGMFYSSWATEFFGSERLDEFKFLGMVGGGQDLYEASLTLGYRYQGTKRYKLGAFTIGLAFFF